MNMTRLLIAVQLALVVLLVREYVRDGFDRLNEWADAIERKLPHWLTWERWGDPITWLHHTLWSAALGLLGGLCSLGLLGSFALGFRSFACIALGFYVVREARSIKDQWGQPGMWWRGGRHRTGWMTDSIMDCLGPALQVWAAFSW